MATPYRKAILNNLISTLQTITVLNGFDTTVALVELQAKVPEQVPPDKKPFIGVVPLKEHYEYLSNRQFRITWEIGLILQIKDTTFELRSTTLNNFIDDVINALHLDITRSGNAVMTKIVSIETDEADVTSSGTAEIMLNVVYNRTSALT